MQDKRQSVYNNSCSSISSYPYLDIILYGSGDPSVRSIPYLLSKKCSTPSPTATPSDKINGNNYFTKRY